MTDLIASLSTRELIKDLIPKLKATEHFLGDTLTVKLQAIRIGDLAVCAIPFETFCEIGLELKDRSPFPQTLVVGLANGLVFATIMGTIAGLWFGRLDLALVLAAAVAVASLRRWRFLSGAAFLGAGLWSLAYLGTSFGMDAAPVAVLNGLGIAVLAGLWLARAGEGERRPDPASLIAAFFLFVVTTFLARGIGGVPLGGGYWAAGLLAAALAAAAWRERAAPLLHAAGLAMLFVAGHAILGGRIDIDVLYGDLLFDGVWLQPGGDPFLPWSLALGGLLGGLLLVRLLAHRAAGSPELQPRLLRRLPAATPSPSCAIEVAGQAEL